MTSQTEEKTDERIALETRCAELKGNRKGIFQSSDDKLRETIAKLELEGQEVEAKVEDDTKEEVQEVKVVEVEQPKSARKKAPRMNVEGISRDDRTAKVAELERADPECKYIFQNASVTDEELAAKGLERTKHVVKNDIVCRTLKEGFEAFQDAKNEAQYDSMQRIDGGTGIVGSHESKAKKPKANG